MAHDYTFRFAEFRTENGKYATLDLHSVVAVVGSEALLTSGFRVSLSKDDAVDLSIILLGMNKDRMKND